MQHLGCAAVAACRGANDVAGREARRVNRHRTPRFDDCAAGNFPSTESAVDKGTQVSAPFAPSAKRDLISPHTLKDMRAIEIRRSIVEPAMLVVKRRARSAERSTPGLDNAKRRIERARVHGFGISVIGLELNTAITAMIGGLEAVVPGPVIAVEDDETGRGYLSGELRILEEKGWRQTGGHGQRGNAIGGGYRAKFRSDGSDAALAEIEGIRRP